MVHMPSLGSARKWGAMLVNPPPPSSEPPPPYSPPRGDVPSSRPFFFPSDLSLAKKARAALNHGPSSAFHAPPLRIKSLGEPPPYSLTDEASRDLKCQFDLLPLSNDVPRNRNSNCNTFGNDLDKDCSNVDVYEKDVDLFLRRSSPECHLKAPRQLYECSPPRSDQNAKDCSKETSHPQGPILRTGKSLLLPTSKLTGNLHYTAHNHPGGGQASNPKLDPGRSQSSHFKQDNAPSNTPGGRHFHEGSRTKPKLERLGFGSPNGRDPRQITQGGCSRNNLGDRDSRFGGNDRRIDMRLPECSPPQSASHIARPVMQPQGYSPPQSSLSSMGSIGPRWDDRKIFSSAPVVSNNVQKSNNKPANEGSLQNPAKTNINSDIKNDQYSGSPSCVENSRSSSRSRLGRYVEQFSEERSALRQARRLDRRKRGGGGRAARLELEAAHSMTPARAFPAHVTTPRMRSCRSLDELSDLLQEDLDHRTFEESSPIPSLARSLDDLTEPLYMNVPFRRSQPIGQHSTIRDDSESPPPLPAKPVRSRTISLSPITIRDEMTNLQKQLEKIKQVAMVLGSKVERGEFSSVLKQHPQSPARGDRPEGSAFRRIVPTGHQRSPPISGCIIDPPGVPSRAPVINDVSFVLNKDASEHFSVNSPVSRGRMYSSGVSYPSSSREVVGPNPVIEDNNSPHSRTPDPDSSSHESGYSSTDSRCGASRSGQSVECLGTPLSHDPSQANSERFARSLEDSSRNSSRFTNSFPSHRLGRHYEENYEPRRSFNNIDSDLQLTPRSSKLGAASTLGYHPRRSLDSEIIVGSKFETMPRHSSPDVPRNLASQERRVSHTRQWQGPTSIHNELYGLMDPRWQDPKPWVTSTCPPRARCDRANCERAPELRTTDARTYTERSNNYWNAARESRSLDRIVSANHHLVPAANKNTGKHPDVKSSSNHGLNQDQLGIYIKSVVPGGSADQDGRLQPGDQLLSVDGRSLVGISQERAAEYMKRTGPTVVLEVARQGAFYHGLATVLEQPSPQGARPPVQGGPLRHASERDLPSKGAPTSDSQPPLRGGLAPHGHQPGAPRMQPAKSVPVLNSDLSMSGELSKATSQDPVQTSATSHQESFRPAYSRASSSNSLTAAQHLSVAPQHQPNNTSSHAMSQAAHQPLRARSSQNLNDSDDRHYQNVAFHAPHPHRSPHSGGTAPQLRETPSSYPRPASALLQREDISRSEGFRPDLYRPASQRDVRVQEPRLVHLPEEGALNTGGPLTSAGLVTTHTQRYQHSTHSPPGGVYKHMPPPTAPKPKPHERNAHPPQAFRPPLQGVEEGNGYRDSPPPPPPPTSTHPLLQGTASSDTTTRQPFFSKTSAWEREEKERYENRRREAARQWRDEQIEQLERQENKTPQEIERLQTLRLEREFELRAKQADEEEGENSEDEDDERITTITEPKPVEKPSATPQPEGDGPPRGVPRGGPGFLQSSGGMNGGVPSEEERAKRADEIRRKQQELEVASEVEQKLIREAQRRQEEEAAARRFHHQNQLQKTTSQQQASQRLDSLVVGGSGPAHEYTNGPVNGQRPPVMYEHQQHPNNINNNLYPSPPERTSSYSVMQQQHQQYQQQYQYNSHPPQRVRSQPPMESPPSAGGTVKRVQFSENHHSTSVLNLSSSSAVSYDANANQEDRSPVKYDHHSDFMSEAENMLNFSPSPIKPGSAHATPGVIGAQEVYRDPRVRRLQEKEAMQAASNPRPAVPETLTFREKMKMFAAETGDPDTPKDKTKISKAQREIK